MTLMATAQNSFLCATHQEDDGVALLETMADMPLVRSDTLKGGICEDVLPEDVAEFFLTADVKTISAISGRIIPIDRETGGIVWQNSTHVRSLPRSVLDFIDEYAFQFNRFATNNCDFAIALNLGEGGPTFSRFHCDSEFDYTEQSRRATISVSQDDLDYETEWFATNGVSVEDMQSIMWQHTPTEEMNEHLRSHVKAVGAGDLLIQKGVTETRNNPLTDGLWHRSPSCKNDYRPQGLRRVTLRCNQVIDLPERFRMDCD